MTYMICLLRRVYDMPFTTLRKRHIIYVIKTVIRGTWVRLCSREDSGVAHGVVSLGTEAA